MSLLSSYSLMDIRLLKRPFCLALWLGNNETAAQHKLQTYSVHLKKIILHFYIFLCKQLKTKSKGCSFHRNWTGFQQVQTARPRYSGNTRVLKQLQALSCESYLNPWLGFYFRSMQKCVCRTLNSQIHFAVCSSWRVSNCNDWLWKSQHFCIKTFDQMFSHF